MTDTLSEEEFRDLQERAQLIQELTQHPGWEMFVDRARHSIMLAQNALLRGSSKSYDGYREDVGYLRGLTHVINLPAEVQRLLANERGRRAERENERGNGDGE